jgi:hypothetical protein
VWLSRQSGGAQPTKSIMRVPSVQGWSGPLRRALVAPASPRAHGAPCTARSDRRVLQRTSLHYGFVAAHNARTGRPAVSVARTPAPSKSSRHPRRRPLLATVGEARERVVSRSEGTSVRRPADCRRYGRSRLRLAGGLCTSLGARD